MCLLNLRSLLYADIFYGRVEISRSDYVLQTGTEMVLVSNDMHSKRGCFVARSFFTEL